MLDLLSSMWRESKETEVTSCAVCSGDASAGITFESIHGSDGVNIKAADLKLERFLSEADLAAAAAAAPASELPAQPTRVLLTGANGFLGRFLLLDLLQRVSDKCAPVLAILPKQNMNPSP